MVMLSDGSWSLLRRCLAQGRNCLIQSDTEKGLNAQVQFVDEETAHEEKAEHSHGHGNKGRAELMVMTPQSEMKDRIEMQELAEYANQVIKFLQVYLEQVKSKKNGSQQQLR